MIKTHWPFWLGWSSFCPTWLIVCLTNSQIGHSSKRKTHVIKPHVLLIKYICPLVRMNNLWTWTIWKTTNSSITYYMVVILNFYYYTSNIPLYDIYSKKLHKKFHGTISIHSSIPWSHKGWWIDVSDAMHNL